MSASIALTAALAIALGTVLGILHFAALAMVTDRLVDGRVLAAAALQAVRLLLLAAVLVAAAWLGALPLLACLAGILAGRWIVLRRTRAVP